MTTEIKKEGFVSYNNANLVKGELSEEAIDQIADRAIERINKKLVCGGINADIIKGKIALL